MPRSTRSDAEARFAKTQARQREAAKAMSDAEAEAKRVDDNTQRLKTLRLARDAKLAEEAAVAADAKAAATEAKVAAKAAKVAAKTEKAATKAAKAKAK
jgi:colicin import membrane protein